MTIRLESESESVEGQSLEDFEDGEDQRSCEIRITELEFDRISQTFKQAGYREAFIRSKSDKTQDGFQGGFEIGGRIGRRLGELRGGCVGLLNYLLVESGTGDVDDDDEVMTELLDGLRRLIRSINQFRFDTNEIAEVERLLNCIENDFKSLLVGLELL
ncbi:hypothetical protein BY996DRAFT_3278380 [Phakopsora pachyrhizi]|uniref:Protein yae1 n=1 Tax=Phakopsora pachyrhizi TaxID=170000 RepID=A0AAV0B410_PHAPC|nr:hypothetical protein BY996DRAFT_3278380 [Phakopsora pachyrhizi]CAH7676512.1 hypothetical protein PPACK8108_LOCUS11653 [Phakopsora pachyrhizi]